MNKKPMIIIVVILILCIIGVGAFLIVTKSQKTVANEIQPEEEISDEQMRNTIVTLYYQNKETKELMPEGRTVDSKNLVADPYTALVEWLIEEPKNEKLQSVVPKGTRVLKTELQGDMVYIDLSKEFINGHSGGEEAENATVYSIVNTLTELNEVNSVKILIDGRENQSFKDNKVNFKNAFVRTNKNSNNKKENSNTQVQNTTQNNNTVKGNEQKN